MINEQDIAVSEPTVAEEKKEAGTLLKERRIELGLTQKQIADRLRLRVSIIEGIEENNFESGQVATFIRGYLRSYAKAVNIDESIVLAAVADCGDAQHQEQQMMSFSRKTKRDRHDNRIMMVTWGILIVIIAISSIWWWQNQLQDTLIAPSSVESVIVAPQTQQEEVAPADSLGEDAQQTPAEQPTILPVEAESASDDNSLSSKPVADEESVISDSGVESTATIEVSNAEAALELESTTTNELSSASVTNLKPLTMSFSSDCWIQVQDASGKILTSGLKKAGENLNLEAESPLNIILGAPESVSMTFASEPVDLSGYTSGKVARLTLP